MGIPYIQGLKIIEDSLTAIENGSMDNESSLRCFLEINNEESKKLDSRIEVAKNTGMKKIKKYISNDNPIYLKGQYNFGLNPIAGGRSLRSESKILVKSFNSAYGGNKEILKTPEDKRSYFNNMVKNRIMIKQPTTLLCYNNNEAEVLTFKGKKVLSAGKIYDNEGLNVALFGEEIPVMDFLSEVSNNLTADFRSLKSLDAIMSSEIPIINDFLSLMSTSKSSTYR